MSETKHQKYSYHTILLRSGDLECSFHIFIEIRTEYDHKVAIDGSRLLNNNPIVDIWSDLALCQMRHFHKSGFFFANL